MTKDSEAPAETPNDGTRRAAERTGNGNLRRRNVRREGVVVSTQLGNGGQGTLAIGDGNVRIDANAGVCQCMISGVVPYGPPMSLSD